MNFVYNFIYVAITATIICCLASCASQIPLTGGLRDQQAPQLDTSQSTKNYLTNFEKQDIELVFNEFIDLREANTQIVISPPLDFPPKVSSRLKKVSIAFNEEEVLKTDATYVINFGKSIRDYTEGNELKNFTFVFSTGAFIDSLSISGQVIDALSKEPKKDALILLYTENIDSIVFIERPFYFARTDETGFYKINNLRADTFKVVALADENLNYLYDPNIEEIGFLDTLLILMDTLSDNIDIEIFKERTKAQYKSYNSIAQGLLQIEFQGIVNNDLLRVVDGTQNYLHSEESNFLNLWYKPRSQRSVKFQIERNASIDTIQARINTRTVDTLEGSIDIVKLNFDEKLGIHPKENIKIYYDRPLIKFDTSLIFGVDTSLKDTIYFNYDSLSFPSISFSLKHDWRQNSELNLHFLPGAIVDFFEKPNDTIARKIIIASDEDFGNIELSLTGFDSVQYVFQLMKKEEIIKEIIYNNESPNIRFERLYPGQYSLQIIVDEIPNGIWDPGNYLEKRQSERIYKVPLEELRANWILKDAINLQNIRIPAF